MASFHTLHRFARAGALTLAGTIALAGCSISGTDAGSDTGTDAGSAAPQVISQLEHVHGLGADPLTGNTYAATHHGVWLVPTGELPSSYLTGAPRSTVTHAEQIAGRAMDTMGFTVAAPGVLLASGHPDTAEHLDAAEPHAEAAEEAEDTDATGNLDLAVPNLGLITSVDAAQTWTEVSLRGETDFHSLEAVALGSTSLRIYGYDSGTGTVSVSDDSGVTWSAGATLPLRDLAVDATNPDVVFATTSNGPARSADAGRTFALEADAPTLLLVDAVDADAGGGLVGIAPDGTVWRQVVDAASWTQTGTFAGSPEAVTFVGGDSPWILAANAEGIAASDDFGVSWTVLVSLLG